MRCLQCQHENRESRRFCAACGSPLDFACSDCAYVNEASDKFCGGCGKSLTVPTPVHPKQPEAESKSRFYAVLPLIISLLQRERRLPYQTLRDAFDLDTALLGKICEDLSLRRLATDEAGKVLVWTGEVLAPASSTSVIVPSQPASFETSAVTLTDLSPDEPVITPEPPRITPEAERRQLTVMFCDLVGSTDLSGKLDPEDLREVVRSYQEAAAEVIGRYEGHIAQYLGDGLLIYFGFPVAHEDDAQRAIYTGLGIPEAMAELNTRLKTDYGVELAVRIGIHTGPVVVGEMGGGGRHENLALGETPNIAARLEGMAAANTAVISPVTAQLVQRSFLLEKLGPHELKGVAEPMMLYTVVSPRESEHDDHESLLGGFDSLVGRDEEVGLLLRRWEQSKDGQGQVVLISGEAGLGKSSLVEGLRAHVYQAGHTRIAFRCSPYTINSVLHPVIEHLQRVFDWQREDPDEIKLSKLEQVLHGISLPLDEIVPLVASLLSLPLPEGRYPALTLSPQQQRQQTQDLLVAWMLEEAERQPLLAVWEDLHWADPSTLELLGLFVEQCATVPMMNVLAYRPEFVPPWLLGPHLTPLALNRLERAHIEALVTRLAGGKTLPTEVVQHVVSKTDGVPLYVEELTKMLLESDLLQEKSEQYVLTGSLLEASIPATLQDSLMARLDRLPMVKEVVQLGAVLGREFAYEILQELAALEESTLQAGLAQLVETELLYQRGRIPRAKYIFRHALIRDAAYQSLLRRTRQQVHEQVARLLEARFPEVVERQPELVAYHYTEANQDDIAIGYWRRAGERAVQHSANPEAVSHLTQGLELIAKLPESPKNTQQELDMQMTLGPALIATKGYSVPEVERTYRRAQALCEQLDDASQRFRVLTGLYLYYALGGPLQMAHDLATQLLETAEEQNDPALRQAAHFAMGQTLIFLGSLRMAHRHLEQGMALTGPELLPSSPWPGAHLEVVLRDFDAFALWLLGRPDHARDLMEQALSQARRMAHPLSLAVALLWAVWLRSLCGERQAAQVLAHELITLGTEQSFPAFRAQAMIFQSWMLAGEEGLAQLTQGLVAHQHTGAKILRITYLSFLCEASITVGQMAAGEEGLDEAKALISQTGARFWEAEVHRLRGECLLVAGSSQSFATSAQVEAAVCFQKALDLARQQQAKSLELRAVMSLCRLWRQQDKKHEARELLAPVYEGFTEGFDTADLQDAKALLSELKA